MAMKISGTFLDAVVGDIPSNNWSRREWAADFDAMRAVGIDTVILIRSGCGDRMAFDSEAVSAACRVMPARENLLEFFLDQAERCGMDFYFGGYNSGQWRTGGHDREVQINVALADEVVSRYGDHAAFRGWYICHEIPRYHEGAMVVYEKLARHLKSLKQIPVMISPWLLGRKEFPEDYMSPAEHEANWRKAFERMQGLIDIVAFQDGLCGLMDLPEYLAANTRLCREFGITCWTNVENFERGMVPMRFLPIDYRHLLYKMEVAEAAGCEKIITFEFSHFMSPTSMYPSAARLYDRYREWLEAQS